MTEGTPSFDMKEQLLDCNAKLSAQVQVQRKQINDLEDQLRKLEDQKDDWKETILCLQRVWEELNSSIAFLNFMTTGAINMNIDQEAPDPDTLEGRNPFLAKLLSSYLQSNLDKEEKDSVRKATEVLTDDVSDIEKALRAKMAATLEAATRVMDSLQQKEQGEDAEEADKGSSANERKLLSMISLLKHQNEKLQNDKLSVQELVNQLADKEDELLVAQRKIAQLKAAEPSPNKSAKGGDQAKPSSKPLDTVKEEEADGVSLEEVEHLNTILADRNAELDAKEAALVKAERTTRELKDKLIAEKSQAARARERAAADAKKLNDYLDIAERRLSEARREKDQLVQILQEHQYKLDQGAHAIRQLDVASAHIRDLESRLRGAQRDWRDAEDELQTERGRRGNKATIPELQRALESAEKEITRLKEVAAKHKAAAQAVDAAKEAAATADVKASEATSQLDTVNKRLESARAAFKRQAAEIDALKQRETELKLFVEVTLGIIDPSAIGASSANNTELNKAKASETALKQRIEQLTAQIDGGIQAQADAAVAEYRQQAEALEESNAALSGKISALEKQISTLQEDLVKAQQEYESVLAEMDSIVEEAEKAKDENKRLVATIVSRDADNARLGADAAEAARRKAVAEDDRDAAIAAQKRAEQSVGNFQLRIADLERQVGSLRSEVDKAQAEARTLSSRCDKSIRDAAEAQAKHEAAEAERKAVVDEVELRVKERDEEAEKSRYEANRAERLARDLGAAKDRLERLKKSGQLGVSEELQAECDVLRSMINCNVCHTRQKDRMIKTCNHLFCSECLEGTLQSRNRKCPGCGSKFGMNDVKPFYFT